MRALVAAAAVLWVVCGAAGPAAGGVARGASSASAAAALASAASALTVSPASGAAGAAVTVSAPAGSLPPGAIAEVSFVDPAGTYSGVPIGRGLVAADGSLSLRVLLVAEATPGPASLYVMANGVILTTHYTVESSLTANPQTLPADSTTLVLGSGLAIEHTITFVLTDTQGITHTISPLAGVPVLTDLFGSFSAVVAIPKSIPPGQATLSASDTTYAASTTLQVLDPLAGTPATSPSPAPVAGSNPTATASPLPTPPASPSITPPGSGPGGGPATPTAAYFAEGFTGQASSNGKASFAEVLNILNPNSATVPFTITYYLQDGTGPMTVARSVGPNTALRESVNATVGPDRAVAAVVTAPARLLVSRTIGRTAADGTRLDGSTTLPAAAPALRWDFPEGYTGYTFQEYLTILNPNPLPVHVRVALAPQAASAVGAPILALTIPALSRGTANIRALNAGNPTSSVGMLVGADAPVVAERVLYFGDGAGSGKFGSTVTMGLGAPATQLRLAYGSSGGTAGGQAEGDQAYITLLNPATSGTEATVSASFADAAGHPLGQATIGVAPGTRRTIPANAVLGAAPVAPFSVSLSASSPIEAEVAQYYGGSSNAGAHPGVDFPALASAGTAAAFSDLSTSLADGTPISRTVYLYNPGGTAVAIGATYFGDNGATAHALYGVSAGGIAAVAVNAGPGSALPGGPLGAVFQVMPGTGGAFLAYAVGQTADGRSAIEEVGTAP